MSRLSTGEPVTQAMAREAIQAEFERLRTEGVTARLEDARSVFEQVALPRGFVEFLTLRAYELL